jgi:hypothetical protein
MPEKTATQDKFNGTCDLIISLSVEETAAWRRMAPQQRQAFLTSLGENMTGTVPPPEVVGLLRNRPMFRHDIGALAIHPHAPQRIADAVQPVGRDPASRKAAKRAKPKFTAQVRRVYHAIETAGEDGLTDEEGQERMVISGNSYRPARGALVKLGLVARSGTFRATRAGNNANIWITISEPPEE